MASKIQMPEIKAKSLKTEEPGGKWFDVVAVLKSAAEDIEAAALSIASILGRLDAIEGRLDALEAEVFPEPEPEPDPDPEPDNDEG